MILITKLEMKQRKLNNTLLTYDKSKTKLQVTEDLNHIINKVGIRYIDVKERGQEGGRQRKKGLIWHSTKNILIYAYEVFHTMQ